MSNLTQQPAAICALKTPADAIFILEAVREGRVPRVTRRLTGHERAMITPGTVWVWEEEETNMRRWTDGRRWGASRVGGGGFLVYTESNESLSPPPSTNPYNPNYYQPPPNKAEGLIKQTYSTTMKTPSGKSKRFHVVAYSRKFNPQSEAQEPLPLPHELPALKGITIQPSNWPEWEQQRTTTEAYARRPPPGVTLSPSNNNNSRSAAPAATAAMDAMPNSAFPSGLPSPPNKDMLQAPSYANGPYLPRDPYDRRAQPYAQPQIYGNDRYPAHYDSRQPGRPPAAAYPASDASSAYPIVVTPTEPWYNSRRERSPPPRDSAASGYLQTPYQYYPRDRYAETSPSYMPYGQPVEYRSPDLRSYEPIDTKPNSALLQPSMARLPLTPNSATSATHELPGTGPSPKLSINSNLLNPPENGGLPAGPGLTLPPLRLTLDDGSINGRKSPNGDPMPSEDVRQLDGLGRKAY